MDTDLWFPRSFQLEDQLLEVGSKRIGEMDSAGVDVQVLSLAIPGCGQFEFSEEGTATAKQTNDELSEAVSRQN